MKQESVHSNRRSRSVNVFLTIVAFLIVALFVVVGVFFYIERASQQAAFDEIEDRMSNLKSRNIPVDTASLHAIYIARTHPEDAAAWTKIFDYLGSQEYRSQIRGMEPFDKPGHWPNQGNLEDQLTMQRRVVQRNAELLKTVHELTGHRQPVQFDIGFGLSSSRKYLGDFRLLIALLTWELKVAIADQDTSRVVSSLTSQFDAMSIVQGEDLTMAHQIFAVTKQDIFKNVKQLVEDNLLGQQELKTVIANLQMLPSDIQRWPETVQYQRAFLLYYLQRRFDGSNSQQPGPQDFTQATAKDLAHFLRYMDRYESASWSSWKTAKESLEKIDADLKKEQNSELIPNELNWRNTLLLLSTNPQNCSINWLYHAKILAQNQSEQNQSVIGCALRLYQKKHGSFPDQLGQLVDVGVNPALYLSMADLPFGYEVQDGKAFLWGPIREGLEFPFSISPSVPKIDSSTKPESQENIKQALWTLDP